LDKGTWVKGYVGYDFALLGDLTSGVNGWQPTVEPNGNTPTGASFNTGSGGLLAGVEFGVNLDSGNALAIEIENISSQADSFTNGVSDNTALNASFQPDLMGIALTYYTFISGGKGSRTSLSFGVGYYQSSVAFSGVGVDLSMPSTVVGAPETGTFTGGAIGEIFGIGQDFALGNSFAMELLVHGRLITVNQVTSSSIANGSGGQYTIVNTAPAGDQGQLYVMPNVSIPSNDRPAVIDYSGFDANLSFDYCF